MQRAWPLALLLSLSACTTETITTTAPSSSATTPTPGEVPPTVPPIVDAPPTAAKGIGEYSEKGLAFLAVSPVQPTSCGAFCTSQGGRCTPALAVEGSDQAAAGSAMYYSSSSSLQVPRLLASCDEVATKTFREDLYYPYTPVLGQLTCSCDDVKVAPRVTVPAATTKSCTDVCVSWKKTCEPKRAWEIGFDPSGGIAFYKTGDAVALGCSELPAAKSAGSALDMYLCACK